MFERAVAKNDLNAVIAKYDHYFHKRDPQLMLREKYWCHLKCEPGHTNDMWVNTVHERANECKFPPAFHEQAVRDKVTFAPNSIRCRCRRIVGRHPNTLVEGSYIPRAERVENCKNQLCEA